MHTHRLKGRPRARTGPEAHPLFKSTKAEIERFAAAWGVAVTDLLPLGFGTLLAVECRTRGDAELAADDDPAAVALDALARIVSGGRLHPLLHGIAARCWAEYLARTVPLRETRHLDLQHRRRFGVTRRQRLAALFAERLGRSTRDLQRFAGLLDLPGAVLAALVRGELRTADALRLAAAAEATRDRVQAALDAGQSAPEVLAEFVPAPGHRRHVGGPDALAAFTRSIERGLGDLRDRPRLPVVRDEQRLVLEQARQLLDQLLVPRA